MSRLPLVSGIGDQLDLVEIDHFPLKKLGRPISGDIAVQESEQSPLVSSI
jgi:hypothetical protein